MPDPSGINPLVGRVLPAPAGPSFDDAVTGQLRYEALTQMRRQRVQAAQDAIAQKEAQAHLTQVLQSSMVKDAAGHTTYDRGKLTEGLGVIPEPILKMLDDSDKSAQAFQAAQSAHLKDIAGLVAATGNNPVVATFELNRAVENGAVPKDLATSYLEAIQRDPSTVEKITDHILGKDAEAPKVVGNALVDPKGHALYTAPQPPPTALQAAQTEEAKARTAAIPVQAQAALTRAQQGPGSAPGSTPNDPKDIANAIISGDQPPTLTGLYRNAGPVRAELARSGYNLTKATEDWTATQKYLSTLNGQQQTRLRQAVEFTNASLDLVDSLAQQWKGSGLKPLNAANLAAAKQGLLGQQAQSIAVKLDAQIADLQSELGTVYKGGNSSTDESLKLAAKNLQSDWAEQTLLDATKQIRQNLAIRSNSLKLGGVAGVPGNTYAPKELATSPVAPEGHILVAPPDQSGNWRWDAAAGKWVKK